jgi:hypothetical protein
MYVAIAYRTRCIVHKTANVSGGFQVVLQWFRQAVFVSFPHTLYRPASQSGAHNQPAYDANLVVYDSSLQERIRLRTQLDFNGAKLLHKLPYVVSSFTCLTSHLQQNLATLAQPQRPALFGHTCLHCRLC